VEKVTLDCYPGPEDLKTVLNAIRLLLEPQHVRKGMALGPCAVSEGGDLYRITRSISDPGQESIPSNSPSWQAKNTASWRMFWELGDARGLGDSCLEDREMAQGSGNKVLLAYLFINNAHFTCF